ncbi:hypothetical protein QTH91_10675 [Variovorax dokdonensis]|uniref:Uncharacterized protein n=1 Tax=Variovorax dokdonensis TaxID=344883 RepID=A0ABT7NAN8_9BURK|nr:hypothetical protein [Variovorax dokdonensis]MDM0044950.1 hypothetical protein [Variovorax dokdonensis]
MQDTLTSGESTELVRLWRRRQQLSPDEMGRMYRIVGDALRHCNPPELKVLGEGRQELVAQFIYVKVLRLDADPDEGEEGNGAAVQDDEAGSGSAPSTAYALCAYFRRYLIDCTRASSFRRKLSLGDQVSDAQLDAQLGSQDAHEDDSLAEHGLSDARVQQAAREFIQGLPEPERLLLCEGFGQEAAGGLSGVAARHAIASYHYRAGRLGLVHKRQSLPADYARTQLGGWIQNTLGIAIVPDNMAAILRVFKILGAEASWV